MTFLDHIIMLTILSFLIGVLLGFIAGALVVRKHFDKLKAAEGKAVDVLDALKK